LPEIIASLKGGHRTVVSAIMGAGKSVMLAELAYTASLKTKADQQIVITTPTQSLVRQLADTVGARCSDVGVYYADKKQPGRQVVITCNPSLPGLVDEMRLADRRCGLWIADEVHKTEADVLLHAAAALEPAAAIGFTATPFRSDEKQRLTLWEEVAYRYTLADALRDGVLVPWDRVIWDGTGDSADVNAICLDMIRERGDGPGVASALTIDDAEKFAEFLEGEGVKAAPIHSKLKKRTQAQIMKALEGGFLRCVVHVNMLSEGVDMPWLRWLCLRRPVSARVRFIQEIGRVLRCHPNKERAVIMDPHDLFGLHGIMHEDALGEALEKLAEAKEPRKEREEGEPAEMKPAVAVGKVELWARRLLLSLQAAGLSPSNTVASTHWRKGRPSDSQIKTLGKIKWAVRHLPKHIRPHVKQLCEPSRARRLKKGGVSDLLSVLFTVADAARPYRQARRTWPWPAGLDVEEPEDGAIQAMLPLQEAQ
jgi:superfamily II DNA or RNA helicase